ncbi:MAG: hypothetical protein B7Y41_15585 [Hydrogenophilales bacterium 28-61-23]|nr:MAG: hypothetical protein B7Y41_15585 [Hydrogenophilales bacterium 28-61-23]
MKTTSTPASSTLSAPISVLTRLSLAALLASPLAVHADTMIDDFSAGTMGTLTGAGSFSESVANVLGGVREVDFSFSGNPNGNSLYLDLFDLGLLSSATKSQIGVYTLTYDGHAGSNPANSGLNLDLSTASAIAVRASADFWSMGSSFSHMSVALTDNSGITKTLSLTPSIPSYDFGDILFNLNDSAFTGLNKSHVDRIGLSYVSALSADTDFDSISIQGNAVAMPVPEADTAAYMLLGVGLVGLLARRRG